MPGNHPNFHRCALFSSLSPPPCDPRSLARQGDAATAAPADAADVFHFRVCHVGGVLLRRSTTDNPGPDATVLPEGTIVKARRMPIAEKEKGVEFVEICEGQAYSGFLPIAAKGYAALEVAEAVDLDVETKPNRKKSVAPQFVPGIGVVVRTPLSSDAVAEGAESEEGEEDEEEATSVKERVKTLNSTPHNRRGSTTMEPPPPPCQ